MRKIFLYCLVFLFATQQENISAADQNAHSELIGTYRLLMMDGRDYNPDSIFDSALFFGRFKTFKIRLVKGGWVISDEEESSGWPMWEYDAEFRLDEKFAERLDNKTLSNAPCLDSAGASRMRICAVAPGETLKWRDRDYTISTGYFAFNGDHLIILEKLR